MPNKEMMKQFLAEYLNIKDGLNIVKKQAEQTNDKVADQHKGIEEISKCQISAALNVDMHTASLESGFIEGLSHFLASVAIGAHYGAFDIDVKVPDGEEAMFGFEDLGDTLKSTFELDCESSGSTESDSARICSGVLAKNREISLTDYLEQGKFLNDLKWIGYITTVDNSESEDELTQLVLKDDGMNTLYNSTIDSILGIYNYTFRDGFGLQPSFGILSGNKNQACYIVDEKNRLNGVRESNSQFANMFNVLHENSDFVVSNSRQFDYKQVLKSKCPVYFPKKMLEFAMGRQLTSQLQLDVYKRYEKVNSWEEYEKGYVKPLLSKEILKIITELLRESGRTTANSIASNEAKDFIHNKLLKIQASYSLILLVSVHNSLGNKLNSIAIRVTDVSRKLSKSLTATMYKDLVVNKGIEFSPAYDISEGKTTAQNQPLPYPIYEYKHDFDAVTSTAEPLFGYKAVELFKKRGVEVSWKNILIGNTVAGTPLFCGVGKEKLPLQGNISHNMMAGSRSGKGVMTMNLLACALASNKAIFYIDRKPDMAVMFKEMTKEKGMFIVNGGQYEAVNDPQGIMTEQAYAPNWKAPGNLPKYVSEMLGSPTKFYGPVADFVYFRAMLFCLGILCARIVYRDDEAIYNQLGGVDGVVFVFDEFKNWQENFESKYLHYDKVFCNGFRITTALEETYRNKKGELKKKNILYQAADKEKEKAKLQVDIEILEEKLAEMITEKHAYATQLMAKIEETFSICDEKTAAGFYGDAGEECNNIDLFVIGQNIKYGGSGVDGASPFATLADGKYAANDTSKGKSLMRGLIDKFKHDWFMGFNHDTNDTAKYIGANTEGTKINKYVDKLGYWAYYNGVALESLRDSSPCEPVLFKPYLVLNNHLEEDPSNAQQCGSADYKFVRGCKGRVNKAVPGLWDSVRLKHVPNPEEQRRNPQYGTLNPGIGFEGLARLTMETTGKNVSFQDVLAKSANIANFVAKRMGYNNYMDLLLDLSPMGMFSAMDIVTAIGNPSYFKGQLALRLPIFAKYNFLSDSMSGEEDSADGYVSTSNDSFSSKYGAFLDDDDDDASDNNSGNSSDGNSNNSSGNSSGGSGNNSNNGSGNTSGNKSGTKEKTFESMYEDKVKEIVKSHTYWYLAWEKEDRDDVQEKNIKSTLKTLYDTSSNKESVFSNLEAFMKAITKSRLENMLGQLYIGKVEALASKGQLSTPQKNAMLSAKRQWITQTIRDMGLLN